MQVGVLMVLFFLTSGLFLGWSLGANDAANVFGTAVATRMVRFRTAAIVSAVFVVIGAVIAGGGATGTLGHLGDVNAMAGAFMVALAAAVAVLGMTKAGLPVSVSQAIVGGIIGWNLFTGSPTSLASLTKIVSTWIICPILAGAIAAALYLLVRRIIDRSHLHLLEQDLWTRVLFLCIGAFGAFSLGANNIANVMGVFVSAIPAGSIHLFGIIHVTVAQQLFAVGGVAIAVGIISYSHRVMMTVGRGVFRLTPVTGLIVILAQSLVLFLFASEALEVWLITHGLPPIPLVPVSSSQAVIGAIIGIAIAKGGRGINYGMLGRIAGGWVATPVIAAVVAFLGLFFLQNVFDLPVVRRASYELNTATITRLIEEGVSSEKMLELDGVEFMDSRGMLRSLKAATELDRAERETVLRYAKRERFTVTSERVRTLDLKLLTVPQVRAVQELSGRTFAYAWEFEDALVMGSLHWAPLPETRANYLLNKRLEMNLTYVLDAFRDAEHL
ncbi:inorganic phosphate transporter family protein [bacterium]|nr:inorganic phosphate transporter family protein [bacterium]